MKQLISTLAGLMIGANNAYMLARGVVGYFTYIF